MASALDIVQQWHSALNTGAVDAMVALVHEAVEIGGPRGTTSGADVVREWFGRANVRLHPLQFFARDNIVVVEENGEWLAPETGEVTGQQIIATVFQVRGGLITRLARYDDLETALRAGNLSRTDVV